MFNLTCMVLSWNTMADTTLSIDSVLREKYHLKNNGIYMKLVVIDNGSDDGTQEYLKEINEIDELILNRENLGISKARNQGLEVVEGKYVYMVDSDISVVKGSFLAMYNYMEEHPEVHNLGANPIGDIRNMKITHFYNEQTPKIDEIKDVINMQDYINDKTSKKHWALTQYGIFRTEIFKECRFDESGPFGGSGWGSEDDDFFWQMMNKGYKVHMFNDIRYYHKQNSSKRNLESMKQDTRSEERKQYVFNKWKDLLKRLEFIH